MFIFDCNGVLVDSEPIAADVAAQEFTRAGFPLTPDIVARYFTGRRPTDMFADDRDRLHNASCRRISPPSSWPTTLQRLRAEVRATAPRRIRADLAARAEMRGLVLDRSTASA